MKKSLEKGEGVFATKSFELGETVIVGAIEKVLNCNTAHAIQLGENEFVLQVGLSRKVNHSCDPNCGVAVNETGAHDFVAMKQLYPGDEITFDYAMQNYDIDHFPGQCLCETKKCRGKLTGWNELPVERRKEYEGFIAPYLIEMN